MAAQTTVPTNCENCGKPYPWAENSKTNIADREPTDFLGRVIQICTRFHHVARQIRQRHSERETIAITDEYDVQDLLHALLRVDFEDIRPEEWTPSYAGGCSRVDFLLKDIETIIEVKKTRKNLKAKQLGEQLIVDIEKYRIHPDCKNLLCFVYDPEEWVDNPKGLEKDLSRDDEDFTVKVIIVPSR